MCLDPLHDRGIAH